MKWLLILIVFSLSYKFSTYSLSEYLEITVLNVDQGDATLIKTMDNKNILIDTGNKDVVVQELDTLLFPRKVIDLMIITHFDSDHFGQLDEILKVYDIKTLILPPDYKKNYSTKTLKSILNNKNVMILTPELGSSIQVDKTTKLDFIWPNVAQYNKISSNDSSISFVLNPGSFKSFFGGDISTIFEDKLTNAIGDIDVLKVSHHGSNTSTSRYLLENIKPEVSLISAGKNNSYGHPSAIVLENLKHFGSEILRTDLHGNLRIRVFQEHYEIETQYEGVKYQNRIEKI